MGQTVDVEIGGVVLPGLAVAAGYVPQLGDTVVIDIVNGDALVQGPRDGPAGQLINDAQSDETGTGSVASGAQLLATLAFAVQGAAGSASRPVLLVFGFTGVTLGNAAGYFYVDVDGDSSQLPQKRWHTQGDSGTWPFEWAGVVQVAPGQHAIHLWATNDGGGSAALAWSFPRIDAFQLG